MPKDGKSLCKSAALIGLMLGLVLASSFGLKLSRQEAQRVLFAMDTRVTLRAYGFRAESALLRAKERLQELEGLWSATDAASEIYQINHSGGETIALSSETAQILAYSLELAQKTGGAFEPTLYPLVCAWGFDGGNFQVQSEEQLARLLPYVGYQKVDLEGAAVTLPQGTQLDLGAIGKGYGADIIAAKLRDYGVNSALIDMGGNILTLGKKPDGSHWRIAVRDPAGTGYIGVVEVASQSVVTSGGYERYFKDESGRVYSHILDPKSGQPAQSGLSSVTVIGRQSWLCDGLSTAFYVMGLSAAEAYWRKYGDFEMILVTDDGDIYITAGLEKRFTIEESLQKKARVLRP